MATTYYIPDETGWGSGNAMRMRAKVVQNYDSSNNRSSLTVTLQFSTDRYNNVRFQLRGDAKVSLNGKDIVNGSSTTTFLGYVDLTADQAWHSLSVSWTKYADDSSIVVQHADNGSATIDLEIARAFVITYEQGTYSFTFTDKSGSKSIGVTRTFKLTITQYEHSIITVKKGSTTLSNNATITYGDVLKIYFNADAGYSVDTHTVNGVTFASGGSHTVASAVAVVASAVLAVNPDSGIRIDNGSSFDSYNMKIDNGATWDTYVPYVDTGSGWVKY